MIPKRTVVGLSILSFISSLVIGLLVLLIVVMDGPFNIIDNPIVGMRIGTAAVTAQSLFNLFFYLLYLQKSQAAGLFEKEKHASLVANILKSGVLLLFASFLFHITFVCFGAPLLSSTDLTYNFSVLLSVLTCLPCCLLVGPSLDGWMKVFSSTGDLGVESVVYLTSVCSLLGTWLGAIPIPLDWDRAWQEWPRSCAVGSLSGYAIGLFLAAIYLPRRYRAISKAKFT